MFSAEALVFCGEICCIVSSDNYTLPGQVAELVVVGINTTSSANCHSAATDVVLTYLIPVLWFGESRKLEVFVT